MLNVSLNLKEANCKHATPIICILRYDGLRLKYYTGEKIHPRHWENRKESKYYQRAKSNFGEAPELNARLEQIISTAKSVYRRYLNEHSHVPPTLTGFKELLDNEFKKKANDKTTLMRWFEQIIQESASGLRKNLKTGAPISHNTVKTYNTVYKHLQDFQGRIRKRVDFDTVGLEFYSAYTKYLTTEKKLSTNAIAKDIQIIKMLMNEATERDLNTNLAFKSKRFATVREKSDNIYLSDSELKAIEAIDLTNVERLQKVRDLFLIGCYTGLRYSDYSILRPENIKDGFIYVNQQKTSNDVVIPVHPVVEKILKNYEGNLPQSLSNQKTNSYLKEIAQLVPGLQTCVEVSITKGGVKNKQLVPKWQLVTSHTARRSFATNEYLQGTQSLTIMAITGHKTEKAFHRYILASSMEKAKLLKADWEQRLFKEPKMRAV